MDKVVYPNKFKAGDIAICRRAVEFADSTRHVIGQRIRVRENTVSYYNVNHQDYDKETSA